MSLDVKWCRSLTKVKDVYEMLKDEDNNGFPILDSSNRLIGLISRNFLSIIIMKRAWFEKMHLNDKVNKIFRGT